MNDFHSDKPLKKWINALALVTFDIDEGQKVEHIVPSLEIGPKRIKQLAMLSFPDSNSFSDYENSFKFTFKMHNGFFGYACFKQKKDPKNPRGFSQKSLVILSELPFVYVFEKMCDFIVFKTFNSVSDEQYPAVMKQIYEQSLKWADPAPKQQYILPVMNYELQVKLPNYLYTKDKGQLIYNRKVSEKMLQTSLESGNKQFNLKNILSQEQLLREGPFQEIKLNQIFIHCQEALWAIWEGVMLNRSLLILGSNPQQVSHAVLGVISLAYPFEYCGNYNPYVTVYDPNLDQIVAEGKNWITGGTNPLFSKLFNKQITQIIPLDKSFKCPKNLKPLNELLLKSNSEEQQAINESAIRKYFYQLSSAVMIILDTFLGMQINSLKFFSDADFMKAVKDRKDFLGLEDVFSSRKFVVDFFQEFLRSSNFEHYLASKNTIRSKPK